MHAPPSFQITVHRFGAWHLACAALVLLTATVLAVWRGASQTPMAWEWPAALMVGVACVAAMASAARRLRPVSLRWDGQVWHSGPAASRGAEPVAVTVTISLDLGVWMLLLLRAQNGPWRSRRQWLPVQRRGHEQAWHGLRATLHGARPGAAQPASAVF